MTVAYTELICNVGEGVGTGLAVDVVVSSQVNLSASDPPPALLLLPYLVVAIRW